MSDSHTVGPPPFGWDEFYTIVSATNLALIMDPNGGGATVGYSGDKWFVEPRSAHNEAGIQGWRISHADTGLHLAATNPYTRGSGPPRPPPAQGGKIYLTNSPDEDYDLWTPRATGDVNGRVGLTAYMSIRPEGGNHMMLNIRGDNWQELDDLITWQWSGGKLNELWQFKPAGRIPGR